MRAFRTTLKIRSRLSVRGADMVIFALRMLVAMVFILGIIFGGRPAYQGTPYASLEQSLRTLSTTAVCAGGVMGLPLPASDYRQKYILKHLQVTSVSPTMILAIHVTVYAAYSLASLVLVHANATPLFGYRMQGSPTTFLLCYTLVMLSVFSIDMMVGGIVPDMKSASATVSVLHFPVLIFFGATLSYEMMPRPVQGTTDPALLTRGVKLLKTVPLGQEPVTTWVPMTVITGVFLLCSCIDLRFFR